jgi:hypothetical protein
MKLDLLTNATVVEDAIRFVEEKSGKPHTVNALSPDEKIEKDVQQQIQGNDKSLSTTNQTF